MMTDTKTLPPDTDKQPPQPKTKRLDISGTQLVGGAFAAMTAAVIGAQLGVAGTVLGAAIGSVVAGTAGSLYTASLKHTQTKIASAFIGRVGDTPVQITTTDRIPDERTPGDRSTVDGWHAVTQPVAAVAPPSPEPVATAAEIDPAGRPAARGPWKPILVATVAVFLLAIAGITAFELITGQSVSGGQGTTISQVGDGRSGGSDTPRQDPSTDTSTTEPTTEPSAPPSTEPSSEPGQVTEPTTAPSTRTQPSTSSEPSASSKPTATPAPSTAGGDQSAEASNTPGNPAGG